MARVKSKQDALIDELLKGCQDPKGILGRDGLLTASRTKLFATEPLCGLAIFASPFFLSKLVHETARRMQSLHNFSTTYVSDKHLK